MSDMSVSFARRNRQYHRHEHYYHQTKNDENTALKKTVAAGVAVGGGYLTKKILSKPVDADAVTLKMHAMDLGKQTKDLKALEGINAALAKEGATLTEDHQKVLNNLKIDTKNAPEGDVKAYLKKTAADMRDGLEAQSRKSITKKTKMLKDYQNSEKTLSSVPAEKQTGKLFEAMQQSLDAKKQAIAKVFHLETDKDGKLVKEFDTDSMLKTLNEQAENLSKKLRGKKAEIKDKLADIKLLNPSDEVAKAFKAASKDKHIKAAVAGVATALGLFYLLKPESKK